MTHGLAGLWDVVAGRDAAALERALARHTGPIPARRRAGGAAGLEWLLAHGADPEQTGAWPAARAPIVAALGGPRVRRRRGAWPRLYSQPRGGRMPTLQLVIGNKNYSSWSMRPWLLLRHAQIPFEELRIPLDTPGTDALMAPYCPGGRVPALIDGEVRVWESLAICEYVAERFPGARVWPENVRARAAARSVACEMHAGFAALRSELPLNCRARRVGVVPSAEARADIERIFDMWSDCRRTFGGGGPWLFGTFSAADAMYAPVVLRLATYGVEVPAPLRPYCAAVAGHAGVVEWIEAARREPEVIAADEAGQDA
jgi:glutathione S-transferase